MTTPVTFNHEHYVRLMVQANFRARIKPSNTARLLANSSHSALTRGIVE